MRLHQHEKDRIEGSGFTLEQYDEGFRVWDRHSHPSPVLRSYLEFLIFRAGYFEGRNAGIDEEKAHWQDILNRVLPKKE